MLPQSLSRFLSFLLNYLSSVCKGRPTGLLLRLLSFLRRRLFKQTSRCNAASRYRVRFSLPLPSLVHDSICAMSSPRNELFTDNHQSSPVDMPYTGSPNLMPVSPTPSRRYTQGHIPWMSGSQVSLSSEPNQTELCVSQSSQPVLEPHTLTANAPGDRLSPMSLTGASRSPSPDRQCGAFVPSSSKVHLERNFPRLPSSSGSLRNRLAASDAPRSPSVISHRSSRTIRTFVSQSSVGRASYRHYEGPSPRPRTPVPTVNPVSPGYVTGSSITLQGTASPLGRQAFPAHLVARPGGDHPGEPTIDHEGPRFAPMSANCVRRYQKHERKENIRIPSASDYTIKAMQYEYPPFRDTPPQGWEAHRHPEGALYYLHREKRTITDVDVYDDEIRADIEYFQDFLLKELRLLVEADQLSLNLDEVELVLEPMTDEEGLLCCYYFVNPSARCLFWTDEWEPLDILGDCKGVNSLPHKGLAIQSHYWKHWDLFPVLCNVTEELKEEVKDMILHATCDHLTSDLSSCPLDVEELKNHYSLVDGIKTKTSSSRGHSAIIIGRIMYTFYRNFFLNFHGEVCARLNFDQSVHGWRYQPSKLMAICAPILFMSPITTVRALHKIFVDEIASKQQWNMFINKLNSQLQDTNLLATVLLNANVGFLAIQSVDEGGGISVRQLASYMSLVSSIASIVLGLVFVGHNRTENRNSAFAAAKFLHSLQHVKHGLETLAIIYSLPHAFLLWAMVLFFVAFSAEWCGPGDITSRLVVGVFMLLVGLLVTWCIWKERDRSSHHWWFQADPKQVVLSSEDELGISCFSQCSIFHRFHRSFWKRRICGSGPESHTMHDLSPPQSGPEEKSGCSQNDGAPNTHPNPIITLRQATLPLAS
ncbi:hypothetical protein F5I97DRAFT_1871264 [Phlebopus sp. FC_14]|nr:hypothetical protein F5I97DRAFT_1871264 [Phlebopus sp. FC_14]